MHLIFFEIKIGVDHFVSIFMKIYTSLYHYSKMILLIIFVNSQAYEYSTDRIFDEFRVKILVN